ncbi:membrane protein [Mycobacterium avium subsp. hominissuis 10-4249]|nr:membrane protein [Mycobacterium avium subsp. hominissuis 10-4249]
MSPAPAAVVLAHGLGGSGDLPVPYAYAMVGAAWALTFTFALVAFAWRRPRFDPLKPGRALPAALTAFVDARATRYTAAGLALAVAAWAVAAGVWGPESDANALLGAFYVLLWVGLVAVSLAIGPVWRVISPIRTLYLLARRVVPERLARPRLSYPKRWGYRPAALGLFAFVWMELASPNPAAPSWVTGWLLVYAVLMAAGAWLCGQRWLARADPFGVYSMAVSRLSPFRRNPRTGRIVVGNPLDHLPSLPVRPGVVVLLAVLLGSTAFDSFSSSPTWRGFSDRLTREFPAPPALASSVLRTLGLIVFICVVALTFSLAARATGGVDAQQRRALPGQMAHSLIPIVVGYIFAHYLSYLVERGQQAVFALADPFDRGWNPLGLAHLQVTYVLSMHPPVLAAIKVTCVVTGHIVAVIAAHDKALRLLPAGHQLTGQLAMMLVMVGYTFTGLYLLFGG